MQVYGISNRRGLKGWKGCRARVSEGGKGRREGEGKIVEASLLGWWDGVEQRVHNSNRFLNWLNEFTNELKSGVLG